VSRAGRPGSDRGGAAHGALESRELEGLARSGDVTGVDARGTWCPQPLVRLQDAVATASPGAVVLLHADDPGVELDVPAWCISTGNEYLGILRRPDELLAFVRKQVAAPAEDQPNR
jgi:TusA-related sulfurtransferase